MGRGWWEPVRIEICELSKRTWFEYTCSGLQKTSRNCYTYACPKFDIQRLESISRFVSYGVFFLNPQSSLKQEDVNPCQKQMKMKTTQHCIFRMISTHQSLILPSLCPVAMQSSLGWHFTTVNMLLPPFLLPELKLNLNKNRNICHYEIYHL